MGLTTDGTCSWPSVDTAVLMYENRPCFTYEKCISNLIIAKSGTPTLGLSPYKPVKGPYRISLALEIFV